MSLHYQTTDDGPVLLVTVRHGHMGFIGHRILLNGPRAGQEVSATKICQTREQAMQIMLDSPPILTTTSGRTAPGNLRVYGAAKGTGAAEGRPLHDWEA